MPMLIGLTGPAGCGKSTAAEYLVRRGFHEVSLARPVKEAARIIWGFTDDQLYGPSQSRNAVDPRFGISPREALQKLGTDYARALCSDVWIQAARRGWEAAMRRGESAVVSDVRFDNEAEAIRAAGGMVIKLLRREGGIGNTALAAHASEAGVAAELIDHVLPNYGSKDALYLMLKEIVLGWHPLPCPCVDPTSPECELPR